MTRFALISLALAPMLATAQDDWNISYNYVEVGYGQLDVEALDNTIDHDGPFLEGSFEVSDHLHVFGTYARATSDDLVVVDTTFQEQSVGMGVHFNILPSSLLVQPAISLFARIGYIDGEFDAEVVRLSDDGITRSFGVRFMPGPRAEFRAAVEYVDLESTRSGTATSIGGDIYLGRATAFRLGYMHLHGEDANALTMGVRFYFGGDRDD